MLPTSAASKRSPQIAPSPSPREPTGSTPVSPTGNAERLLSEKLAGTAQRRALEANEIRRLAARVDFRCLAASLAYAKLLPLLGSRLVDAAPALVPDEFRATLESALSHARRRAAMVEQVTLLLVDKLEDEGVPVVALKGPHLAERLHGDAGMRSSNDIDLLVQPEEFHHAVAVLERIGYRSEDKAPWIDGLPLFEASLRADDAWRPPIDLHWRLHWYEERFSRHFVRRSRPDERGFRKPQPVDDLAALLLYWCRDGLIGVRHAADIGAWWDRYGEALPPRALDEIAAAYPPLRPALAAAALHAEQLVGVPAQRLLSTPDRGRRRVRLAARFAEMANPVVQSQTDAQIVLIDALLTPQRAAGAFVRRHLVLPAAVIAEVYGVPPSARVRRTLRRAYYALRVGEGLVRATGNLVWGARSRQ